MLTPRTWGQRRCLEGQSVQQCSYRRTWCGYRSGSSAAHCAHRDRGMNLLLHERRESSPFARRVTRRATWFNRGLEKVRSVVRCRSISCRSSVSSPWSQPSLRVRVEPSWFKPLGVLGVGTGGAERSRVMAVQPLPTFPRFHDPLSHLPTFSLSHSACGTPSVFLPRRPPGRGPRCEAGSVKE